jgi:hypothetical protein
MFKMSLRPLVQLARVALCCFALQPSDVSRWFTLVGIVASFISTFFAHGFLTLAKKVSRQYHTYMV